MGKRLTTGLIFTGAAFSATPAWANALTATPMGIVAVLAMPLLILGLTAAGGAAKVMAAKGHRRWKTWEIVVGMLILLVLSPVLSPGFAFFLALVGIGRGLQMTIWGIMALKPPAERKPYLSEAEPRRLLGAGAALLAGTVLLAAISVSDLGSSWGPLIRHSNEIATKGNLEAVRSALARYHGDNKGVYPPSLDALTEGGKYLQSLPPARIPGYHPASGAVTYGKAPDDKGGWLYDNDPKSEEFGKVLVNCTHTDIRGSSWASY